MQRVSLLLNVLLLATLAGMFAGGRKRSSGSAAQQQTAVQTAATPDETGGAARTPTGVQPFRWSQIESPDYTIYIANLRGIGCPEQTVHDIIRADVGNLYATKRKEMHLEEQSGDAQWSKREESQLLAMLLGEEDRPVRKLKQFVPSTPVLPLAFRPVNLADLGLTEEQSAAVGEVRREFVKDIGGLQADPSDPDYANGWQKAQPQNDIMLRGMIGTSAYMRYQLESGD